MKHKDSNSNRILSKTKFIGLMVTLILSLTITNILIAQTFTRITNGIIMNASMYSTAGQWIDNDGYVKGKNLVPTITVTAPNGGENWKVGSLHVITWTSSNVASLKIDYTTNNGSNWTEIIASTPASTGVYYWIVPSGLSAVCKIRITDVYDSTNYDMSNNVFTIYNPTALFTPTENNLGITTTDGCFGCAWGDYDSDGDLDLFIPGYPNVLYRNDGGTQFVDVSAEAGIAGSGFAFGAIWADFDGDSDLDLLRTESGLRLYRNDGSAFIDISAAANLSDIEPNHTIWQITAADYDKDGDLDVALAGGNQGASGLAGPTRILQNDNMVFSDVKNTVIGFDLILESWNPSWVDVDNDGDPDLWLPTIRTPNEGCALLMNQGSKLILSNPGVTGLVAGSAIASSWGDFDNDEDMDLYLVPYWGDSVGVSKLYRNNSNGTFTDMAPALGLDSAFANSRGVYWGDYDNDGDQDLLIGGWWNHTQKLYRNDDGTFVEVGAQTGAGVLGCFRSVVFVDYDNDGFLDLYYNEGGGSYAGGTSKLLLHNRGNSNHWIVIKPKGTTNNSAGIGARITVVKGPLRQIRDIQAGAGGITNGYLWAHFGLGDATIIDSIKVQWPNGIVQFLTNVAVNQFLTIAEKEIDKTSPVIAHTQVVQAPTGESQIISATITDNYSIQSAMLYYRKGGASSFASTEMKNTSGDNWEGTIPASFITEWGTEYYISVSDIYNNKSTYPESEPQNSPQVIQVNFSNLSFAKSTPAMAYQMISVPVSLDNTTPFSVLEDDLGGYNDTQWRLLQYANGTYNEYPNVSNFEPGKGFWLITKESKSLDTGAGKSVTTAQNYIITLQPGWNQIGNPFAFTVNWSDVIKDDNVESQLVGYSGSSNDESGYEYDRTQLVPFEGYFVKNNSSNETTIEIPPKSASGSSAIARHSADFPETENLQGNEWMVRIKAKSGRYVDKDNYIGVLNSATDEWDSNDFSEAPFFEDLVSLYFPHLDWDSYPGLYTGDFRSITSEGHYWDFNVKTNTTDSEVTLILTQVQNLPSGWEILLLDKNSQTSLNFAEHEKYSYIPGKGEIEREFRIVVGQAEFIDANDLDLAGIPQDFTLSQNYPNPFNLETRLNYELPKVSDVNISVFNLNGQLVQTLFAGQQSAGQYVVGWDGTTQDGFFATSGIYLVRMKAEKYIATRKIVLNR